MSFVPQENTRRVDTEFWIIIAEPGEIAVMPKGARFRVVLVNGPIRGYIAENYGVALSLPERWLVMEDSFRPPSYHMNVMSEFMGLIYEPDDAKPEGFKPGAMSQHNALVAHGPDSGAFEKAEKKTLEPERNDGVLVRAKVCATAHGLRLNSEDPELDVSKGMGPSEAQVRAP